jgi:uncharacterized protein YutE (UPF0331/DUF86 family)
MNDAVVNKASSIQRCIRRAREEYRAAGDSFSSDYTRQDAAVLNITRACEQAIDLANHVVRTRKLGVPDQSRKSFELLAREGFISPDLASDLVRMVGFRNIAIHQYQDVNIELLATVISDKSEQLLEFSQIVLRRFGR